MPDKMTRLLTAEYAAIEKAVARLEDRKKIIAHQLVAPFLDSLAPDGTGNPTAELLLLLRGTRNIKVALGAFATFHQKVEIDFSRTGTTSDTDMAAAACQLIEAYLVRGHGKFDNAMECLSQLLTGTPDEKWSVIDRFGLGCRVCSHCGSLMVSGLCVDDGEDYLCSKECAADHYDNDTRRALFGVQSTEPRVRYTVWGD